MQLRRHETAPHARTAEFTFVDIKAPRKRGAPRPLAPGLLAALGRRHRPARRPAPSSTAESDGADRPGRPVRAFGAGLPLPAPIVQAPRSASTALRVAPRWPSATVDPEHGALGSRL